MNCFDQDSGNRGKTGFFAAYEPGTNLATKLVEKEFSKPRKLLDRPYQFDCQLRG